METTIKTDCFAYKCEECSALKSMVCKNSNCNFYKPKKVFMQQINDMYGISDVKNYFKFIIKEGNNANG